MAQRPMLPPDWGYEMLPPSWEYDLGDFPIAHIVPFIHLDFAQGLGLDACYQAVCWTKNPIGRNRSGCGHSPTVLEECFSRAGSKCPADRVGITTTIEPSPYARNPVYISYPPVVCGFAHEACAEAVCGLQRSIVNATKRGTWECFSDPFIATYAPERKLWFENMTAEVCKGSRAQCWPKGGDHPVVNTWPKGMPNRRGGSWPSDGQPSAAARGLGMLAVVASAVGVLASVL